MWPLTAWLAAFVSQMPSGVRQKIVGSFRQVPTRKQRMSCHYLFRRRGIRGSRTFDVARTFERSLHLENAHVVLGKPHLLGS